MAQPSLSKSVSSLKRDGITIFTATTECLSVRNSKFLVPDSPRQAELLEQYKEETIRRVFSISSQRIPFINAFVALVKGMEEQICGLPCESRPSIVRM